jgi:IS5 family transposase
MRPKKHETTKSGDLFRARLDQIINLKYELAQLAGAIDWDWIDGEIAPLYSEKGRPGITPRTSCPCWSRSTTSRLPDAQKPSPT